MSYVFQSTLQYSTFIKRTIVEAMQASFENHPDKTIRNTDVTINLPRTQASFPSVVIKFFEREMPNAGLGHYEWLQDPSSPDDDPRYIKFYHRIYKGDISFDVYALSPVDRDVVRDGLIEVLAMQDVTSGGINFLTRLYAMMDNEPYGDFHYPVLNLDLITGYGEQQSMPAWAPEDDLVYQVTYRVPIFGEYYSNPPTEPATAGFVEEVDVYPWIIGTDTAPTDPPLGGDPNSISGGYYKFTGWRTGQQDI